MNFNEALNALKDNKKVKRAAWSKEDGYLVLLPGMAFVWKIVLVPNPNAGNFIFSVEDFLGEDWEEYSEVQVIEAAVIEAEAA